MTKLDKLIEELCPNGVEFVKLGDVCSLSKGIQFNKSDMQDNGTYPVINGGINPSGYIEQYNQDENTITISQGGASAGYVNWIETKFWAGAHCYILKPQKTLLDRYLYHFVKSQEYKLQECQYGAGIPALAKSTVSDLSIPLPPLPIQEEIVRILDNFTKLTAELEAELEARKKQYEFYRDSLLKFDIGGGSSDYIWKPLHEISEISTGSHNTNEELEEGDFKFFVRSQEVRRLNSFDYDETAIITSGDGVGVGKIFHYVEGKYALHQRAYRIHITSSDIFPKFFYYYMKTTFLSYIEKTAFNSSVTSIRRPMLNNYPVPIPPLTEQERIVSILDRFDKLCNDITEGLPAEIEARRKQYEYYRDKLLTFTPVSK